MERKSKMVYDRISINGGAVRVAYKRINREKLKAYFQRKSDMIVYVTPRQENPANSLNLYRFKPRDFTGYNSALDFIKREYLRKCESPDYLNFWIRLFA